MKNVKLNDLLFPVEKVKNENLTNSEYAYIVKGIVNDLEIHLNYCSNRYEVVENALIFPKIEALLNAKNVKFTVNYQMENNCRFYANYILEDEIFAVGTANDKVKPVIKITHSYNGLTKYSITFGYFRLICSNGLAIPLEGHEDKNLNVSGKHTKDILNSLDSLFDRINKFFDLQPEISKRFEVLTDRKIDNYGDRIEAVLNATNLKPSKLQLQTIEQTITKESIELYNGSINDWLIYNGINAYIYKSVDAKGNLSKALPEKMEMQDKKVLDYMLQNA
jgi:hypothetical protein